MILILTRFPKPNAGNSLIWYFDADSNPWNEKRIHKLKSGKSVIYNEPAEHIRIGCLIMQDYTDRYTNRYRQSGPPAPTVIPGYSLERGCHFTCRKDEFIRQHSAPQNQQETSKFPHGDSNPYSENITKRYITWNQYRVDKDPSSASFLGTPSNGVCVKNMSMEVTEAMVGILWFGWL